MLAHLCAARVGVRPGHCIGERGADVVRGRRQRHGDVVLARDEQPREHIVLHLIDRQIDRQRVGYHARHSSLRYLHLPSTATATAAAIAATAAAATTPAAPAAASAATTASTAAAASFPVSRLWLRWLQEEDERPAQQLVLHVIEPRRVRARR